MQVQQPKTGYKYVNTVFDFFEEVPEDWEVRPLSSFATEINRRFSKDKKGPVLSVTKYKGFVKSLEYFKKQIFSKDIKKYKLVEKGNFAYATIHLDEGSLGLLKEFEYGYISPMYTVFRTDDTINPDYLYLLLKTESYLQKYSAMGEGTVNRRKSISFENLSKLKIPLPHLEGQNKIASILSNVDSLIHQTQKEIEQTQRLKKGLMQKLLTKGIGHNKFKKVKSLFGKEIEIPEEWKIFSIRDTNIKIIDGDRGDEYPKEKDFSTSGFCLFLSAKNVTKDGFLFDECSFISKQKDQKLRKGCLSRGDIVITTRGTVGNIAYFDESIPFDIIRINSGMAIIRNYQEFILQKFLYYLLKSPLIVKQLESLEFGSAQPQLTIALINSLKIIIPQSIREQQKIAYVLSNLDSKIQKQQEYKSKLETLKKGLMQKLLTGQIKVKI